MTNLKKVVIVGGHEQACNLLKILSSNDDLQVVLCIARQDDSGEDGIFPSLMKLSKEFDIPTLQPAKLNAKSVLSVIERLSPDIIFSMQNNMIFGDPWLDLMGDKLGIVNVHYAPLPRYGGYWPEMWAIWNNESKFAVTMHYVERGLDTGPIIAQKWFDIDACESRWTLYKKSTLNCLLMLEENLERVLSERVAATKQLDEDRTYYPKSLPNDGYIDLSWDAEKIGRFIRAISFPGFPGPKIRLGDQSYTILSEDLPFFLPYKLFK